MGPQLKLDFVNKTDFPLYAITCVADRYVIVAGGGGSAKTGIKNKFEVYQLYHNGKQTTSRCVLSYDVGDYCISNMTAWTTPEPLSQNSPQQQANNAGGNNRGFTTPCPTIYLALGKEESCMIVCLTPCLVTDHKHEEMMNEPDGHAGVRQRVRPHSTMANGVHHNASAATQHASTENAYYSFDVTHVTTFKTVFPRPPSTSTAASPKLKTGPSVVEDVYQKACRITSDNKFLAAAGTDGTLRLWDVQQLMTQREEQSVKPLCTIAAHTKEVDQLDLSPNGKQVVSVCKSNRECCVWSWQTGKRLAMLAVSGADKTVKYKVSWARYGSVEDKPGQVRLFTVSNPLSGSKNPGLVTLWAADTNTVTRQLAIKGILSNLSISSDGRYLATGTMDGDVIVLVAFSLQVMQRIPGAHGTFVTGVDWLSQQSRTSCIVRGFSDASVLSVSCDNCIMISHVPSVSVMPVWLVAVIAALVLLSTFLLASYVGL